MQHFDERVRQSNFYFSPGHSKAILMVLIILERILRGCVASWLRGVVVP